MSSHGGWQCRLCSELSSATSEKLSSVDTEKWRAVTSAVPYEMQLKKALAFMIDFMSIQNWVRALIHLIN